MVSLARHADLALYDSTFTESEIVSKAGLGPLDVDARCAAGKRSWEVKHLCLFHHDPSHDDDFMDKLAAEATDVRAGTIVARRGPDYRFVMRSFDAVAIARVPFWSSANGGR